MLDSFGVMDGANRKGSVVDESIGSEHRNASMRDEESPYLSPVDSVDYGFRMDTNSRGL